MLQRLAGSQAYLFDASALVSWASKICFCMHKSVIHEVCDGYHSWTSLLCMRQGRKGLLYTVQATLPAIQDQAKAEARKMVLSRVGFPQLSLIVAVAKDAGKRVKCTDAAAVKSADTAVDTAPEQDHENCTDGHEAGLVSNSQPAYGYHKSLLQFASHHLLCYLQAKRCSANIVAAHLEKVASRLGLSDQEPW